MLKWKYYTLIILMLIVVCNMSSCKNAEPENAEEEISVYNWILKSDSGTGRITFDEGKMKLEFTGDAGKDYVFSGEYHSDENNIYIESEEGLCIKLGYRPVDDKLYLKYSERELCFYKEQRE